LGSYASAPALDPNGNALIDGALYYNSTNDTLYSYNLSGTAWEAASGPKGDPGTGLDFAYPGGPVQELNGVVTFYLADASSYSTGDLTGPAGADGADGANGNTILYGSSDPTTEGVDGDFWINTTSNTIFGPKATGSWPSGTSLVGPTGPTGATGATGPQGPTGPAGADGSDASVTTQAVADAGALMESELTSVTAVKALDQGVATTSDVTFGTATLDAATVGGNTVLTTATGATTGKAIAMAIVFG
jgi:hypothetical protein